MQNLKKYIPVSVKSKLVQLDMLNRLRARKLAMTAKRLDLCAAQFALLFHLLPATSLTGKVCLEIGSGWVLSHAIICYLLGARKVIATDVMPMATPACLKDAIHKAEPSIVRDVLAPYAEHSDIRERLNRIMSIEKFTFDTLRGLGIEYRSPFDLTKEGLDASIDFMYSFAVLEHIPVDDVLPLLVNGSKSLKPGGSMVHCIHLEDHRDFNDPFVFLSEDSSLHPRTVQTIRGNRLRRSQWREIFHQLKDTDWRFIYEWSRNDRALPEKIDPSVLYEDEMDLRVSHLGVYAERK